MRKTKSFPLFAAVAAATALAATVSAAPAAAKSTHATAGISCSKTLDIGMLAPLTGAAGFLGQEQLSWAKYAIKTLPATMGLQAKLVLGDLPVEKGQADAQAVAQKFIADKSMVGVVGGSTSGSVVSTSTALTQGGLVQVSPSATRTTLTKGDNQQATKAFYRVVPADDFQGSTDAKYMLDVLKVKNVVIFDFQEPYSLGLGGEVEKDLKAAGGVTTSHQSVANTVTDFSSYVTKVPSDADIVFFPTQSPGTAQAFAQQLVEQGKKAKLFTGDGANGLGEFKAAGSYLSSFAPSITGLAADKAIIAGWKKDNGGKPVGSFGPAAYAAVHVILSAAKLACTKGGGTIAKRTNVISQMKNVHIDKGWILGGKFAWSKVNVRDPNVTKFYILQIQSDGSYKLMN
jgi:branched-chain amino acid transport system substrate-binding protein